MNGPLSISQIVLLCAYAFGMMGGQILFKLASMRVASGTLMERGIGLLQNGYFLSALAIYFALSVLWVWILSFTPLSRAYPFVALAFVLTPLAGGLLFSEPLSLRLVAGIVVILGGLLLVAG